MLTCQYIGGGELAALIGRFGLLIQDLPLRAPIPGSYWGEPEAGLIGNTLYLRPDTPVHSALHETSHYVCMTPARRRGLDTDAGGSYTEENAVCYLQILLADWLTGSDRERIMRDMDSWGYTFRLGCAAAWFARDADDARNWLRAYGLIDTAGRPAWNLRGDGIQSY